MTNSTTPSAPAIRRAALRGGLRRAVPALVPLLIAVAWMAPIGANDATLRLESPDRSHVNQLLAVTRELPVGALVLVACDADLGTYPEIRAATRALLADLADHGARTAIVSFTPEGRAIAVAERERIAREGTTPPTDLGFVAGSEAGLVRGIASIVPDAATDATADAIRKGGGGIAAFDLVVVISGSDLSARSWVEQVGSRLPKLKMAAIAPTFLDPELEPYLGSGQLVALLGTLREGVGYAQAIGGSGVDGRSDIPGALPMLVGMLLALLALAEAALRRGRGGRLRPMTGRRAS